MASGTQQHQYQQQQHPQQQQQQELPIQQQASQMQFVSNQGLEASFDPHQQMHQLSTMSPIASTPMSVDLPQTHMVTMSSHQPQANQMMNSVLSTSSMNQDMCNQSATQQHLMQPQQQQKSQLLPLLLSPIPTSLKTSDHTDQPGSDHDQIIDQVISLENDYSDPSGAMTNVENLRMQMPHQSQHHLLSDRPNPTNPPCATDNTQLSNSSEDLLNLLLEMDGDSTSMTGGNQQLDQDEKVGIETIRKQLMGCEVQSDQLIKHGTNSMSPIMNQYNSGHMSHQVGTTQQPHHMAHHNVQQQQQQHPQQQQQQHQVNQHQLISQNTPVISPHQQQPQHQISTPGPSQRQQQVPQHQHRLSVDQTLLHGSYSNAHTIGAVPVSASGQSYTAQQHQNISRISQSTPMSMDNNSPSPSWQQPQLSPFSPPNQHNDPARPSSQLRQHPVMQQHPTTTSPQIQQLHHPIQRQSPSQSISPPATTEPSPVVKKNPLLNAQLVNSRVPSIGPSRFMNSQSSVLNQNPMLNSKLSQNSYISNSCNTVGSPVNPSLNPQPRFTQEQQTHQQQSNFNYDITQQQQNAQQHTTPQTGYMSMYGHSEHQQAHQPTNQMFRTSTVTTTASSCNPQGGVSHMTMGSMSPSGGLSQQVKQEIRKKVQQPKQQHQTTSLLKQLLSDDNK